MSVYLVDLDRGSHNEAHVLVDIYMANGAQSRNISQPPRHPPDAEARRRSLIHSSPRPGPRPATMAQDRWPPASSATRQAIHGSSIIKSVLGFRQFLLRGLDNVRGEWSIVTMAWNMKRMFAMNTTQ
jgi:hypothetical protein